MELAKSRGQAAIGRWVRVSLSVAVLCTSVACGWGEELQPPTGSSGLDETAGPSTPTNTPTNTPTEPSTDPVEPAAVAAYAVRWHPSTSEGVKAYELTIAPRSGGSDRIVTIPVGLAQSGSNNTLSYEISLETDHDHVLSLRAYDGSTSSPPSNEIIVRASALIASAATEGPSAATAFVAEAGSDDSSAETASNSSDTATASTDSGVSGEDEDGSATGSSALIGSSGALASLEFDGSGSHLEGSFAPEFELAPGSTFAAWLRPMLDDGLRRMVLSAGSGPDADFDALELSIVDGGSVELVVRDNSGGVGHRSLFAAGLEHDAWQYLALVFDAEAERPFTLYVDGTPVMDDGMVLGDFDRAASDGRLRIGAGADGDGYAGRIGHVAVWSRALDGAELVTLNELGHDVDLRTEVEGDSLAHYWRLGEGEAAVESDLVVGSDVAIDLAPAMGDLIAVSDAPEPLE